MYMQYKTKLETTRNVSIGHEYPPMTKSQSSCKTCNIPKSNLYGHLHVMLVSVCGYEQNSSKGVGEVTHTRFRVVRTY